MEVLSRDNISTPALDYIRSVTADFTVSTGQLSLSTVFNARAITLSVPSFLSVSGSPVTGAAGAFTINLGSDALPIANGGTGLTAIGPANTVLSSNGTVASWLPASTVITTDIGVATGTSLSLNGGVPGVIAAFTTNTVNAYTEEVISYSPSLNRFVAVGRTTNAIATSTDGITWTPRTLPHSVSGLIYFANVWIPQLNLFMIGGVNGSPGSIAATSPDGINWVSAYNAYISRRHRLYQIAGGY